MHRKFPISTCIKRWYLLHSQLWSIFVLRIHILFKGFGQKFKYLLCSPLGTWTSESILVTPTPILFLVLHFPLLPLVWLLFWLVCSLWDICFQFRRLSPTNKCKFYAKQATLIVVDVWFGAKEQGSLFGFLVRTDKRLAAWNYGISYW